ncbi:MAG: esterase-like activity of phytase family protein [Phycisphaeraceae bacterium]|nr:esterase-like activity of phytase family protein [Phycisphaeraceae bacterium]
MPSGRLGLLIGLAAAIWSSPIMVHADGLTLQSRGSSLLPATTVADQFGSTFTITGVSGLTYLGPRSGERALDGGHRFLAVMDNSDKAIHLGVWFAADGSIVNVQVEGGLRLSLSHDHEGVAYTGPKWGTILVSDEDTPAVREFDLASGTILGVLPLPAIYAQRRANFGLESLTVWVPPAGDARVWTANEEALEPDGPVSSPSAGTWVRVQRFDGQSHAWSASAQWAYRVESMHGNTITGARSGLVDLIALPNGRLLALERSFAFSLAGLFRSRLYEVMSAGATDTSGLGVLADGGFAPVGKRLLWQGPAENLEGLALGPILPDGSRSLLGVVDDGDPISQNRLVAFALSGVVEPSNADLNWDLCVDIADLLVFLDAWLVRLGTASLPGDIADRTADGLVDVADLLEFLSDWLTNVGSCRS